jgi:hypothetical protein
LRTARQTIRPIGLALGLLAACAGCQSRLAVHVAGNQLVTDGGWPIRLLGVNRSGAEYACVERLGIVAGPIDRRAVAAMAAWRINAVRIPLNEDCWLGINKVSLRYGGERYRAAISRYVARLHRAGLYVVLDLHWNAPGHVLARGQQAMADLDHAPAFWSSVARTFRADPAVLFELYNEPFGISWQCWRDGCLLPAGWRTAGMQTLVDAVRSEGADQPIIVTGLDWGGDLTSWLKYRPHDPAHQLIAGLHVYDFRSCVSAGCWTEEVQTTARDVPVVTTELGQKECSSTFIDRFMSWADQVGVSYLAWAWDPAGCSAPALIRSWDGEPTASGDLFRTHLSNTG